MTPSDRNGDTLDDSASSTPAGPTAPVGRSAGRVPDPRRDDTTSLPTVRSRGRRPSPQTSSEAPSTRARAKAANGRARPLDGRTPGRAAPTDETGEITTMVAAIPASPTDQDAAPEAAVDGSPPSAPSVTVTTPIPSLYDGDADAHHDNGAPPPPASAAPSSVGLVTEPIERIDGGDAPRTASVVVPVSRPPADVPLAAEPAPAFRPAQSPILWRRRPRVRRVTRVVRHVDPWSVFKISLVFSAVLYGVCLTSGVLLWEVAQSTGTVDNVERFLESGGWETFEFKGGEIFHHMWIGGLFAAAGLVGLAVLTATLFNLITDLVGGVRVTVLEEEVVIHEQTRRPGRWQAVRAKLIPEVEPDDEIVSGSDGGIDADRQAPTAG